MHEKGGPLNGAWRWFTRKDFRHCFALKNDGANWILIDPSSWYLDVQVLDVGAEFDIVSYLYLSVPGLRWQRVSTKLLPVFMWWGPGTCVSAIKRLLQIREWWIITPYQLWRYLLRQEYDHGRKRTGTIESTASVSGGGRPGAGAQYRAGPKAGGSAKAPAAGADVADRYRRGAGGGPRAG